MHNRLLISRFYSRFFCVALSDAQRKDKCSVTNDLFIRWVSVRMKVKEKNIISYPTTPTTTILCTTSTVTNRQLLVVALRDDNMHDDDRAKKKLFLQLQRMILKKKLRYIEVSRLSLCYAKKC